MTRPPDDEIHEALEAVYEWNHPVMAEDDLVCECFGLSLGEIRAALLDKSGVVDIEYLRQRLHLGTGCGRCIKRREDWMRALKRT